jgi:hypothetical protein
VTESHNAPAFSAKGAAERMDEQRLCFQFDFRGADECGKVNPGRETQGEYQTAGYF